MKTSDILGKSKRPFVDYIEVYRDEEYIRTHTRDMSPEEARKFALSYYGWDDDDSSSESSGPILDEEFLKDPTAGIPF